MEKQTHLETSEAPTPTPKDITQFTRMVTNAIDFTYNEAVKPGGKPNPQEEETICLSFLIHGFKKWWQLFTQGQTDAGRKYIGPKTYWGIITDAVETPEVKKELLRLQAELPLQEHFNNPTPAPASHQITPGTAPETRTDRAPSKDASKTTKQKTVSVTEHILKHAPSKSYEMVYSTVLAHTKNRFSSRGKKVYPYGQANIARLTELKLRTVSQCWSWLKKRGILNKACNENPKDHHCSLWYVCTSVKQIGYFRDRKNRSSKTKPHN